MNIRPYKNEDYEKVGSWWAVTTGKIIPLDIYNQKWSYVAEISGAPVACVSLITTNSPHYCYLEAVIGDPTSDNRTEAIDALFKTLESKARSLNFKKLIILSENDKVTNKYKSKDFTAYNKSLTFLSKEL